MWTRTRQYSNYAALRALVEQPTVVATRAKKTSKPAPRKPAKTASATSSSPSLARSLQTISAKFCKNLPSLQIQNSRLGKFHSHGSSKWTGSAYTDQQLAAIEVVHTLPSVLLVGRCNAGKSSVVNALVGAGVARVKAYAGLTPCLNVYVVGGAFCIVDSPGYGVKGQAWQGALVESALSNLPTLKRVFVVADAKRGTEVSEYDLAVYDMLAQHGWHGKKLCTVLNKCDLVDPARLAATASAYSVETAGSPLVAVAATKGVVGGLLWAVGEAVGSNKAVAPAKVSGSTRCVEDRERMKREVAARREVRREKKRAKE